MGRRFLPRCFGRRLVLLGVALAALLAPALALASLTSREPSAPPLAPALAREPLAAALSAEGPEFGLFTAEESNPRGFEDGAAPNSIQHIEAFAGLALIEPEIASRFAPASPETRIGAFELLGGICIGAWSAVTPELHWGCGPRAFGIAPGFVDGAWTDPVTGLAYHRQRWYDPRTASWLSEDAYGDIDSPNLYAYVGWGPQSGTDPMGTMLAPIPLPVPPTPAPRPPHTARGPLITPRPGLGPRVGSIPAVAPTNVIEEFWATRPRGAGAFALGWKTADELTPDEQEDFLTRRMQYRSDPSIRAFVESFGRDEFEEFIIKNDIPVPMAAGGGDGDEPPGPRRPNRWDFIRKYHDDKATEVFGAGGGRRVGQRTYDKDYRGRDIEFKSDNFLRRHRSEEELARMQKQLGRDAENAASGRANPHWHFLNDPSVAPEMRPILDALANSGISWTYGNTAPVF